MDEFPERYKALFSYDVLVLDNIHAIDLAPRRRVMIADFVKNGGGLLYFGGSFNPSFGGEHNTYLAELIPVKIVKYKNFVRNDSGMPLEVVNKDFFHGKIDWSKAGKAFFVDTSPLKPGVEVLAQVGKYPAIVRSTYGKGRVVTFLINPHGDYPEGVTPYWKSSQWHKILSSCIAWLAEGYKNKFVEKKLKRKLDPRKTIPAELQVTAAELTPDEFTRRLRSAKGNMIDARNSRIVLKTALQNYDKIVDKKLFGKIVNIAAPYVDGSFASITADVFEKLEGPGLAGNLPFVRAALYRVLGLAGKKQYRELIEKGLLDSETDVVRDALIALAELEDPAAVPAIKNYLYRRRGTEKLLAMSIMLRLGEHGILENALPLYVSKVKEKIHLKSKKRFAIKKLYGGVSFKLTRSQRRRLKADLNELRELEEKARFDLKFFVDSLAALARKMTDDELKILADFFAGTESKAAASLAYSVLAQLPQGKIAEFRKLLSGARLPEIRILSQE